MSKNKKPPRSPNYIDVHVGRRMRIRRTILDRSQEELATHLGVTFQQVQKYELGHNRISAGRLYEIANFLTVPVQYFFEDIHPQTRTSDMPPGVNEPILDFAGTNEGVSLYRSFQAIKDKTVRQAVLALLRALAKPPPNDDITG